METSRDEGQTTPCPLIHGLQHGFIMESDIRTPGEPHPTVASGYDPALTAGDHALDVIRQQTRRLGKLHGQVLKDDDVEPLHQFRVSLRRLRTALRQFAPALAPPGSVSESRIGRVARRTSLTRDLDVLRERLLQQLLPVPPEKEQKAFRPALKLSHIHI